METTAFPHPTESSSAPLGSVRLSVIVVLILWFTLVASLGAAGAFVGLPRTPPIAVGIGVGAPLLLFFAWLRLSPSFREFVLSLDLRLVASMQAWRWAGFGFLALYAHNVLPAVFALPAGLGDMAVGITAPWMLLGLIRQPGFATSKKFVRWNVLGIVDLVVAVSIATLSATLATGAPGEISTAPMATLPLVLIPAFLVPLFLMMHATALMQSRKLAAGHKR
jgi:hypothetical protein